MDQYTLGLSIGDAITALGIIIIIEQFLKPIYEFRLSVANFSKYQSYKLIIFGFICVFIASILKNFPSLHKYFVGFPLMWELAGITLISSAYIATSLISVTKAKVTDHSLKRFVQSTVDHLSRTNQNFYQDYAEDLRINLPKLILYAKEFDIAQWESVSIEFEDLKKQGKAPVIHGTPDIDAFITFKKREDLNRARLAGILLHVISDPAFCQTLVCNNPILVSQMLEAISYNKLYCEIAERFVRELTAQALIHDDSLLNKEINGGSFAVIPLLSNSIFANQYILSAYKPLQWSWLNIPDEAGEKLIKRINKASQMVLQQIITNNRIQPLEDCFADFTPIYERVICTDKKNPQYYRNNSQIESGISALCEATAESMNQLHTHSLPHMYAPDSNFQHNNYFRTVSEIAYNYLENVSVNYDDYLDRGSVLDIFNAVFNRFSDEPEKLTPLQQQLAVMLIKKFDMNMNGWHPPISKILICVAGPWIPEETSLTPFNILRNAIYQTLIRFPNFYRLDHDKAETFLVISSVKFDPNTNELIHINANGEEKRTNLLEIQIPQTNLYNRSLWRLPEPN